MSIDLTAILIAAVSLMGVLVSTLQARAANRRASALERRKLDIESTEDHWKRTDAIILRLSAEIERLDETLRRTREAVEKGEGENATLRARLAKAEVHIARLKTIVEGLSEELRAAGLPIPDGVVGALDDVL